MGKKAARPVSKISSAANPAASGATVGGNKSSILRSAFSPSEYQLALFASVIQGLDAQHIRIHDVNSGRLRREHAVGPKEVITSLDWGILPGDRTRDRDAHSKKKRKRSSGVNVAGVADDFDSVDAVVAFGTNTSEIRFYSPNEDKVIHVLSGAHQGGVRDFKFTAQRSAEGWSIGNDNQLVQWDLRSSQRIRSVNVPTTSTITALSRPLPSKQPVLCGSEVPYLLDDENPDHPLLSFPAMRNSIHTLYSALPESVKSGNFLAADDDRYINVFDPQRQKLVANLVAEKGVSSLSLFSPHPTKSEKLDTDSILQGQVLATVVADGSIELFTRPFLESKEPLGSKNSLKARSRQMTRRSDAAIRLMRSGKLVSVVETIFQGSEILVAWARGGVELVFERIKWQDEDTETLAFTGNKEIDAHNPPSSYGNATLNGDHKKIETQVDESNTVTQSGQFADDTDMHDAQDDVVSISSEEDDVSDDEEGPKETKRSVDIKKQNKSSTDQDVNMENADGSDIEDEDVEGGEPSFGEMLRANAAHTIDVEAELEDDMGLGPLVPGKPGSNAVAQIPSGVSLSTVLTQALRTNDSEMLESCFHVGDLDIVRATIQRLDSALAALLLQKLSERLAARPGRYGHLLVWVQWTCIAHGGAIAGNADVAKRMSSLFKIMDQRSSTLPSLLLLKGKLDMLDAQLTLRQSSATTRRHDGIDSEDDEDLIYVEGQDEENDSDLENAAGDAATTARRIKPSRDINGMLMEDEEDLPNGLTAGTDSDLDDHDDDDNEDDGEEDEEDNMLDIEAEESLDDSSEGEGSLDEDEDESDEEGESDGSMADFIADSDEEGGEELSDLDEGHVAAKQPEKDHPPPKRLKTTSSKKMKGAKAAGKRR